VAPVVLRPLVGLTWQKAMMNEIDRFAASILNDAHNWLGVPACQPAGRLRTVRLCDVSPQPVEWLWPDRIPLGQLTLLCGQSGLGKSFLTLDLAARTSRGVAFPGREEASQPPSTVILVAGEDDVAAVVKPRLEDAGADLERILLIDRVEVGQTDFSGCGVGFGGGGAGAGTRGFSLATDLPALNELLDENPDTRLVVLDPVCADSAALEASKNGPAGRALDLLAETAAAHRVAIVAVTRLPNGPAARAFDRWLQSAELAAAARAAWLVAKDRDDPRRRLLLPIKMNLCADPTGLAYRIKQGRLEWERRAVRMTAAELVAAERERPGGGEWTERHLAARWLKQILADGPLTARDVKQQASECGFTSGTVRRAMKLAGIKPVKSGFEKGAKWIWTATEGRK
jgi:putative DNA primase/helicase